MSPDSRESEMSLKIFFGAVPPGMPRRAAEKGAVGDIMALHLPGVELRHLPSGAPCIDGAFISITHARNVAAVAVSGRPVGIDLEYPRPQLERIAHKFLSVTERQTYTTLPALLHAWTAKEAAFKACHAAGFPISVITQISLEAGSDKLPAFATTAVYPSLRLSLRFAPQPDGALLAIAEY